MQEAADWPPLLFHNLVTVRLQHDLDGRSITATTEREPDPDIGCINTILLDIVHQLLSVVMYTKPALYSLV